MMFHLLQPFVDKSSVDVDTGDFVFPETGWRAVCLVDSFEEDGNFLDKVTWKGSTTKKVAKDFFGKFHGLDPREAFLESKLSQILGKLTPYLTTKWCILFRPILKNSN